MKKLKLIFTAWLDKYIFHNSLLIRNSELICEYKRRNMQQIEFSENNTETIVF